MTLLLVILLLLSLIVNVIMAYKTAKAVIQRNRFHQELLALQYTIELEKQILLQYNKIDERKGVLQ